MERIPSQDCESTFIHIYTTVDTMSRGKRDVVRMAFRILDTEIETEQSSTHVFNFAVFDVSFWLLCFPILLSDLIFNVNIFLRILLTDVIFGSCFVFILLTGMIFQKFYVSLILLTGMIFHVVYVFTGERCTSQFRV